MENKSLLPAIVALLIVVSIASISTTSVSATHTPTVTWSNGENTMMVKAGAMTLSVIVQNGAGSDPIDNVRIIFPSGFSNFAPLKNVPKDNVVQLATSDNENVWLKAGESVKIIGTPIVTIPENTPLIRLAGDNIYVENMAGSPTENRVLLDNVHIMKNAAPTATGVKENDNVIMNADWTEVSLNENDVVMLVDTPVESVSGNIVKFPENTWVKVHDDTNCRLVGIDNVRTEESETIVLDNGSDWVTQEGVATKVGIDNYPMVSGAWIRLWINPGENDENRVVLPAGSIVRISAGTTVMLYENENVRRAAPGPTENVYLTDPASVENQPENWKQNPSVTDSLGSAIEWNGDDNIVAGGSTLFPFAVTTLGTGTYTFYVRTKDTAGDPGAKTITLIVDNIAPTITSVTASPLWVKDNQDVTITVTASESLANLDNVMVAENNAPENTQISMVPNADNTVWTGTYTTGDNSKRDGTAYVYVIGAQIEDLVGNVGSGVTDNTFTVDRLKPLKPVIGSLTEWPDTPTRTGTWNIEGTAYDNFRGNTVPLENGTVRIRVGTTIYNVTANAAGHFIVLSPGIPLTQGTQEVGISYIDMAGNVGDENAENIIYDSIPPVITPGTISGKALVDNVRINDNTPTVTLSITDATMGIENVPFGSTGDNHGYSVQLQDENGVPIGDNLVNATPPAENMPHTISFENVYPTALADGTYQIYVIAGDNLQMDNLVVTFVIDTTPPAAPTLNATVSNSPSAPDVRTSQTVSIGGTAEPGATIRIWVSLDPFTSETNVENTTADAVDGTWAITLTIDQGVTVRIRVSQVDTAGNESTKALYGYLKVDASAPVVVITSPATGTKTDKSTITVSGTVTKDAWESYTLDITLRLQNGVTSTSIVIPIANDGTFSVNVTLAEGKNSIIATATDSVGNYTSYTVIVERTVTSWAIYAIILVIIALILAAIAIFRMR